MMKTALFALLFVCTFASYGQVVNAEVSAYGLLLSKYSALLNKYQFHLNIVLGMEAIPHRCLNF